MLWLLFGLFNVIVVIAFTWFYRKKIKEEFDWDSEDKVAFATLLVLVFLGGIFATLIAIALLICLIINFIKYIKDSK
jgi:hypothetical protein